MALWGGHGAACCHGHNVEGIRSYHSWVQEAVVQEVPNHLSAEENILLESSRSHLDSQSPTFHSGGPGSVYRMGPISFFGCLYHSLPSVSVWGLWAKIGQRRVLEVVEKTQHLPYRFHSLRHQGTSSPGLSEGLWPYISSHTLGTKQARVAILNPVPGLRYESLATSLPVSVTPARSPHTFHRHY